MAITWLPDANRTERFGIDQARYQPNTDYSVMASAAIPPVFGAARSSISWGYTDSWCEHHLKGYKSIGINERLAYHVLFPQEDAQAQVNRAVKAVVDAGIDPAKIVPVEDAELVHDETAWDITMQIERMLPMYQASAYGRKPVIYTRPQWVNQNMLPFADWYEDVIWWMAAYTFTGREANEGLLAANMERYCPAIPLENVLFFQTSERGKGSAYGAASESIDYDRFRGSHSDWLNFWGIQTPPPPPPPDRLPIKVTVPAGKAVVEVVEEI